MQAQALMGEWRAEAEDRAEAILRDLIAATPNFAPAMVALAQIINVRPIIYPGKRRAPEAIEESLALSARAVAIDPLDSRAHLCRSWSHAMSGQHSAALAISTSRSTSTRTTPGRSSRPRSASPSPARSERATELVAQARAFGMRYSRAAQGYIATALYL